MPWDILKEITMTHLIEILVCLYLFYLVVLRKRFINIESEIKELKTEMKEIRTSLNRIEGALMTKECCMLKDDRNNKKEII
jgi:hypothetical protein